MCDCIEKAMATLQNQGAAILTTLDIFNPSDPGRALVATQMVGLFLSPITVIAQFCPWCGQKYDVVETIDTSTWHYAPYTSMKIADLLDEDGQYNGDVKINISPVDRYWTMMIRIDQGMKDSYQDVKFGVTDISEAIIEAISHFTSLGYDILLNTRISPHVKGHKSVLISYKREDILACKFGS